MHSRFLLILSITLLAFCQVCMAKPVAKKSNATSSAASSSSIKKGKYFDRVVIIVMENQDYDVAYKDKFLQGLNKEYGNGILLTNYLATTHPSQPNYVSLSAAKKELFHLLLLNLDRHDQWIHERHQRR